MALSALPVTGFCDEQMTYARSFLGITLKVEGSFILPLITNEWPLKEKRKVIYLVIFASAARPSIEHFVFPGKLFCYIICFCASWKSYIPCPPLFLHFSLLGVHCHSFSTNYLPRS